MRRRSHLFAALAAGGVVALCAALVGVAVAAASPRTALEVPDDAIPQDLVWPWVNQCIEQADLGPIAGVSYFSVDAEGGMRVEIGEFGTDGTPVLDDDGNQVIDQVASEVVGACVATRRIVPDDSVYRDASPAERMQLYDWSVRQQQPCLASRGIEVEVQPLRDYLDPRTVPWYLLSQYVWTDPAGIVDDDFDVLLEARLACPPMPPYLAAQGVGW